MSNEQQHNRVTLLLDDLIWCILGDDRNGLDCASIPHNVAAILEHHLSSRLTHKIQFNDEDGNPLVLPRLWRYKDWLLSQEKWQRAKNYSEKQRIERWLLEKNVSILSKAIAKQSGISIEQAQSTAYKIIKSGSKEVCAFFGVNKLVDKKEEL